MQQYYQCESEIWWLSTNRPRSLTPLTTGKTLLSSDIPNLQSVLPTYIILHVLCEIGSLIAIFQTIKTTGQVYFEVNINTPSFVVQYSLTSSAYNLQTQLLSSNKLTRSLINNMNKRGPITLPCTTPLVRLVMVESDVPTLVCCVLFCKKQSTRLNSWPEMP